MAPAAHGFDATWLDRIGRDPRTLGAVQRRIETVLRDPAFARRVSGRIARRLEEGRGHAPEPLEAPAEAHLEAHGPCRCATAVAQTGAPRRLRTIIGACDLVGPCPLVLRDPMLAGSVPRLSPASVVH